MPYLNCVVVFFKRKDSRNIQKEMKMYKCKCRMKKLHKAGLQVNQRFRLRCDMPDDVHCEASWRSAIALSTPEYLNRFRSGFTLFPKI